MSPLELLEQRPTAPDLIPLFERAFLIRGVEERLLNLFGQGKLYGTVHTCIGQEWTGIAVAQALQDGDTIFSNHRCHGHYLAWTDDVEGLIAELMGARAGSVADEAGANTSAGRGFLAMEFRVGLFLWPLGWHSLTSWRVRAVSASCSLGMEPWVRVYSTKR